MIQICTNYVLTIPEANKSLREFQKIFPKRKIVGVSMTPYSPDGWFMTITYEVIS